MFFCFRRERVENGYAYCLLCYIRYCFLFARATSRIIHGQPNEFTLNENVRDE